MPFPSIVKGDITGWARATTKPVYSNPKVARCDYQPITSMGQVFGIHEPVPVTHERPHSLGVVLPSITPEVKAECDIEGMFRVQQEFKARMHKAGFTNY